MAVIQSFITGKVIEKVVKGSLTPFSVIEPVFSGTATPPRVFSGDTFYGDSTEKQTGTYVEPTIDGTAQVGDVIKGKTFSNTNIRVQETGTLELTGDATESDILEGKTAYTTNPHEKQTGTFKIGAKTVTINNTTYNPIDDGLNAYSSVTTALDISVKVKDINFYSPDVDDVSQLDLIDSYYLSDLPLSTLPTENTIDGLTFQEWNYTLEEINALTQKQDIGSTYKTSDGKTKFYITLTTVSGLSPTIRLYKVDSGTMIIDWGDINTTEITTTGTIVQNHNYTENGDYVITITFTGRYYIPNLSSTTYILGSAIYNQCLTKVELSEYIINIGSYAFNGCYSLKSIIIPSSVTSIGDFAFEFCRSLISIIIPNSVTSIGSSTFLQGYSLTSIIIPSSVTSIGGSIFNVCYLLTSITIPSSITSIVSNTFNSCYSLTSVTIPNSVTSIGASAFYYCTSLTSITIPSSVTSIGSNAFAYCFGLIEYDFSTATSVPTLSSTNAFNGINLTCKILVPTSLYASWILTNNWIMYADYIYPV